MQLDEEGKKQVVIHSLELNLAMTDGPIAHQLAPAELGGLARKLVAENTLRHLAPSSAPILFVHALQVRHEHSRLSRPWICGSSRSGTMD